MKQQQKQVPSGEQSMASQKANTAQGGADSASLSISLKNLPLGTTEEVLLKTLADIKVVPVQTTLQASEKEVFAEICFKDFQSCKLP